METYAYNGTISASFQIDRGIRQGDPLFPYLFIIAVELLALAIRSCSEIGMQTQTFPIFPCNETAIIGKIFQLKVRLLNSINSLNVI